MGAHLRNGACSQSRSSTQNAAEDFEFPDGHVRYAAGADRPLMLCEPFLCGSSTNMQRLSNLCTCRYETMIVLRPDMTDEERCVWREDQPCRLLISVGQARHASCAKLAVCFVLRDSELAKFEAFLSKLGGSNTRAMVRGRQRLAYPISKCVR